MSLLPTLVATMMHAWYIFVRESHYKFHRLKSLIIALFISIAMHILRVPMGS